MSVTKLFAIFILDAIVVWDTQQMRRVQSVNVDESAQGIKRSDVGAANTLPFIILVSLQLS